MNLVEFVITTPEQHLPFIAIDNRVRQTHGVIIDIIIHANDYIVLCAPYLKDLEIANPHINTALIAALKRRVKLHVISTEISIEEAKINQYKGFDVSIYTPKQKQNERNVQSHAKFCLSDGKQVYLGSANFTFSGLNRNLEMGVYCKGNMAKQVESFWSYLIDNDFLIASKL